MRTTETANREQDKERARPRPWIQQSLGGRAGEQGVCGLRFNVLMVHWLQASPSSKVMITLAVLVGPLAPPGMTTMKPDLNMPDDAKSAMMVTIISPQCKMTA